MFSSRPLSVLFIMMATISLASCGRSKNIPKADARGSVAVNDALVFLNESKLAGELVRAKQLAPESYLSGYTKTDKNGTRRIELPHTIRDLAKARTLRIELHWKGNFLPSIDDLRYDCATCLMALGKSEKEATHAIQELWRAPKKTSKQGEALLHFWRCQTHHFELGIDHLKYPDESNRLYFFAEYCSN